MLQLFQQAGYVAWPLGICSILALGIILERFYTFWRLRQIEERAFAQLRDSLRRGEAAPDDPQTAGAPVARIVESLIPLHGASEETIQQAADIALSLQRL